MDSMAETKDKDLKILSCLNDCFSINRLKIGSENPLYLQPDNPAYPDYNKMVWNDWSELLHRSNPGTFKLIMLIPVRRRWSLIINLFGRV
jgi:hypothetical protein